MLDQLTPATFEPLIGRRFHLQISGERSVKVELISAMRLPIHPGGRSPRAEPFVLEFRGPKEFVLPQRIYSLEQEAIGQVEIFLVPIGPDEMGQRYEAVFN